MGLIFGNNQSLTTSSGYVVASDVIEAYSEYRAPAFHMGSNVEAIPTLSYILFNVTYYNDRGLYSSSTGRFTAPTAGLYWFWFGGHMRNGNNKYCSIRKNGSSSWELRVYSSTCNTDSTYIGGYKLFYLNQGDYVSVYNYSANLFGGNNYTYFCGGLIQ